MKGYDVIVVGLGTAGSATCMELARRGVSVLGIDAFRPPHDRGSHHGKSRSIRRAYLEGTAYVPMAMRAWELWRKLEKESGIDLLVQTANLTLGPPDAPAVNGFFKSARTYDIPFEELTGAEVRARWPLLTPPDTFAAGLETGAGIIFPERGITAMLDRAERAGARLCFDEKVIGWAEYGDRAEIHTSGGRYQGERLLLAAGARNRALLGSFGRALLPKRVPVFWVAPPAGAEFSLGAFPVNFWQVPRAEEVGGQQYAEFYSLPVIEEGGCVKVAPHNGLLDCDPETMSREVAAGEAPAIRDFLGKYLPSLKDRPTENHVCLYTLTSDGDFFLGPIPEKKRVFAAALAGHGFKFAPVIGEILADFLEDKKPAFDVEMFSPGRFSAP
jgi:sarcosine oxidase